MERQDNNVSQVCEQIERDDCGTADQKCARQIATRILYFGAGERDVVPGRLGEERAGHRSAQHHDQGETHRGLAYSCKTQIRTRRFPSVGKRIPPGTRECGRAVAHSDFPTDRQTYYDQSKQRRGLRKGERVLNDLPGLQTVHVGKRQKQDQRDGDDLLR